MQWSDHERTVTECSFSCDRRLLATSSFDNSVLLWDMDCHSPVGAFIHDREEVNSCKFSPNGRLLASASDSVQLWDVKDQRRIAVLVAKLNSIVVHSQLMAPFSQPQTRKGRFACGI